jgi:hypothetical protein
MGYECIGWTELAQFMGPARYLVSTVMNLRVPCPPDPLGFSRATLLHVVI